MVMSLLLAALMALQSQDKDFDLPRGLLESHGSTAYQLSSTDFLPVSLSLKEGEVELRSTADWTNTFVESRDHLNYYETLHVRQSFWYGVDDRLSVGLSQSVSVIGGGYLDGFINNFHKTFGIHSNRVNYPSNKFLIGDITNYRQLPSSVIASDLMLSFQYKVIDTEHYGFYIGDQLQFPTGTDNDYYQHRRLGAGVFATGFYDIDGFRFFGAGDIAYVGVGEVLYEKLRPVQVAVIFGVDYKLASWLSAVVQITSTSGPADFDHYASWASEAEAAFRVKLSGHVFWELGATEHLIRYDNNADFGLHTGLTLKW